MLFTRKERELTWVLCSVIGAETIGRALRTVTPRKLRVHCDPARMACSRPPPRTSLALRADCKMCLPIDLKGTQVIAALGLYAMRGGYRCGHRFCQLRLTEKCNNSVNRAVGEQREKCQKLIRSVLASRKSLPL